MEGLRACGNDVMCGERCPYEAMHEEPGAGNCIASLCRDALNVMKEKKWMEMTMNPADSVFERAIKTYGEESQLWMVIEEMSELAKEICKYKRGMNNPETIAEEIADVQIMLEQAKIIFGNSRRVNEMIEYKLNRLQSRLDKGEGNG